MLWTGWCEWCSWLSCYKESHGYCWNRWTRAGDTYSTDIIFLRVSLLLNASCFLAPYFRMQFSELWLQFSILVILTLQKEKSLIHHLWKMKNQNFIFTWQQSFSCVTGALLLLLCISHNNLHVLYILIIQIFQVWSPCIRRCSLQAHDDYTRGRHQEKSWSTWCNS